MSRRMTKADRRQQLITAARDRISRSGVGSIKMTDIADAADVNVALLYQHFPSKEALIEAAVVQPLRELVDELRESGTALALDSPSSSREGTRMFHRALLRQLVESITLLGTVHFADPTKGERFYREHLDPLIDEVTEVSRSNSASWRSTVSPRTLVHMTFGSCWSVAMEHAFTGRPIDIDAVADEITWVLLRAVT